MLLRLAQNIAEAHRNRRRLGRSEERERLRVLPLQGHEIARVARIVSDRLVSSRYASIDGVMANPRPTPRPEGRTQPALSATFSLHSTFTIAGFSSASPMGAALGAALVGPQFRDPRRCAMWTASLRQADLRASDGMAKGNSKFTKRLRDAVESLHDDADLDLLTYTSGSLFTPVFKSGAYKWAKVMDSDGLLVAERAVGEGVDAGAAPPQAVKLLVGVVIQSEDATSQTKPNPLGKAALAHVPNGVWVDLAGVRRRLDRVHVVFVLPKGAAPKHAKRFATAKRNVENAAALMLDAHPFPVARGASAAKIEATLGEFVRPFFKGPGRPKST